MHVADPASVRLQQNNNHCGFRASLQQVEDLDLALRQKNKEAALSKLNVAKSNLDTVIASLL